MNSTFHCLQCFQRWDVQVSFSLRVLDRMVGICCNGYWNGIAACIYNNRQGENACDCLFPQPLYMFPVIFLGSLACSIPPAPCTSGLLPSPPPSPPPPCQLQRRPASRQRRARRRAARGFQRALGAPGGRSGRGRSRARRQEAPESDVAQQRRKLDKQAQ